MDIQRVVIAIVEKVIDDMYRRREDLHDKPPSVNTEQFLQKDLHLDGFALNSLIWQLEDQFWWGVISLGDMIPDARVSQLVEIVKKQIY